MNDTGLDGVHIEYCLECGHPMGVLYTEGDKEFCSEVCKQEYLSHIVNLPED
jgi:Zn ribbon nucleic-acid-binding protein